VEQGRWSYRSEHFGVSDRAQFSRGRALKSLMLSRSLKATGTHGANQSRVWEEISAKQQRMNVASPTSAMADLYEHHEHSINDYTKHFVAVPDQVGVMFAIDGAIEGMDLFGATDTLSAMLPKLTRSFAIDALETAGPAKAAATAANASYFLDRIAAADTDQYPGVGLGEDIRLAAPLVAGGGLVFEDTLVHLVAFAIAEQTPGSQERPRRPSVGESRLRARRYSAMRSRNAASRGGNDDNGNGEA
jgi:hypothetical protein